MKGRNSCHSPLVFSRFLKRQLSGLCERSEQREGKPKRAAGGREPHSWEDASPTNRPETLGLGVQQVAQHGFRVFLRYVPVLFSFLSFFFFQKRASSSTQAIVHHCETLNGVGAVNQHELGKPPPESPPLTHRTNLPRRQRAPAHRLSEPLLRCPLESGG